LVLTGLIDLCDCRARYQHGHHAHPSHQLHDASSRSANRAAAVSARGITAPQIDLPHAVQRVRGFVCPWMQLLDAFEVSKRTIVLVPQVVDFATPEQRIVRVRVARMCGRERI